MLDCLIQARVQLRADVTMERRGTIMRRSMTTLFTV